MRSTCSQAALSMAFKTVLPAVPSRHLIDILRYVEVTAEGQSLTVRGTDLQLEIICSAPAKVTEPGCIAVPARTVSDLMAMLAQEDVRFEVSDGVCTLNVQCGRTEANVKGQPAHELPQLAGTQDCEPLFRLNQAALKQGIEGTAWAASKDESRPVLTGILTKIADGGVTFAAADGFCLAIQKMPVGGNLGEMECILPATALAELARLCSASDDAQVAVSRVGESCMGFDLGATRLNVKMLAGQFPDYAPLVDSVPPTEGSHVSFDTQEAIRACSMALVFARDACDVLHLAVSSDGRLGFNSSAHETGDNDNHIEACVDGDDRQIAVNARFLLDALRSSGQPRLTMQVASPTAPLSLRPASTSGADGTVTLIMPVSER